MHLTIELYNPGYAFAVSSRGGGKEFAYHFVITSNQDNVVKLYDMTQLRDEFHLHNLETYTVTVDFFNRTFEIECRTCGRFVAYTDDLGRALNLPPDFSIIGSAEDCPHDNGKRLDWNQLYTFYGDIYTQRPEIHAYTFDIEDIDLEAASKSGVYEAHTVALLPSQDVVVTGEG